METIYIVFMEVPIRIKVTSYTPGMLPVLNKLPEDCSEGYPEEVEWELSENNVLFINESINNNEDWIKKIDTLVLKRLGELREQN